MLKTNEGLTLNLESSKDVQHVIEHLEDEGIDSTYATNTEGEMMVCELIFDETVMDYLKVTVTQTDGWRRHHYYDGYGHPTGVTYSIED